jgi:hypothetical protein
LYPTTAEGLELQETVTLCGDIAIPDPVRVSTVGVLAALLVIEMLPDVVPLVRGVKVRVNDALWPAVIVVGKDKPPRLNSGLVEVAEEIFTLDPVAVRVALSLSLVPTVTLPKLMLVAPGFNRPEEMPVPDRAIFRAGFKAFDTTTILPLVRLPTFGVKRTLKVTLCPLFRLRGKLKPLKLNPAPVTVAFEIVAVELPELVKVSWRVWLLPTWILPKLTLDGLAARRLELVLWKEEELATRPADIRKSGIVNTAISSREIPWGHDIVPVLNGLRLDRRSR